MNENLMISLSDAIFGDIEDNEYLNELYKNMLYNYALKILRLTERKKRRGVNIAAALRFADLLSKSTHPQKRDNHRIWAQEIVTLLLALYPDDEKISYYAGAVLSNTGNFLAQNLIKSIYTEPTAFEQLFSAFREDYLTIPAERDKQFYYSQKRVYDHLQDECFSYSAPTSMGKSFVMRMFIKEQVFNGVQKNFALVVPTKALINEVRSETINDLKELLEQRNYRIVSAAGDLALEKEHNFILVLTPERLLYLMNSKPDLQIDYLFIDEAHKISGKNSRGPFYYSVVDDLSRRKNKPRFIFASPNIPNPEVYLALIADGKCSDNALATFFSPVSQFKFLVNLGNKSISVYNDHTKDYEYVCELYGDNPTLDLILRSFDQGEDIEGKRTIVYFSGKDKAIEAARSFAEHRVPMNDPELKELARDVRNEVHGEYYLAELIEKGVAYHIGYLPSSIRMRIEKLFKKEKITAMFCTSTLLEGVNLPADNLFITSFKNGRPKMSGVDFRNLIGRVGRIQFNLCGNVFFVSDESSIKQDDYLKLLRDDIKEQKLSLVQDLKPKHKKQIARTLLSGSTIIDKYNDDQPEEEYIMMRKFAVILLRDIVDNRDSLVRKEFSKFLSTEDENIVRSTFSENAKLLDNDINISLDQTKRLRAAIIMDPEFSYPKPDKNGYFVHGDVVDFLSRLGDVFNWKKYEYSTLGKVNENGDYSRLGWYATILVQWMEGNGLSSIMRKAIEHRKAYPSSFWLNRYTPSYYMDTREHKNIVFADTLEVIENIVLFSISNYFLRFSNEYKLIHGEESLNTNNWYEYVEYGTMNPITIQLQRFGFSREAASYIRTNKTEYVYDDGSGEIKLRRTLLECKNLNVKKEAEDIQYNVPELFVR
jgi:superfamily II DNA/RNA helicase